MVVDREIGADAHREKKAALHGVCHKQTPSILVFQKQHSLRTPRLRLLLLLLAWLTK